MKSNRLIQQKTIGIKANQQQENVVVEVFNMLGQKVITLMDKNMKAGSYELEFNSSGLSSGVYFYAIQAGEFKDVKKMIMVK